MASVNITKEAHDMIRRAADGPLVKGAVPRPDGSVDIPLSDETHEALMGMRLGKETASDTIIRLASFFFSGGKHN